MSISRSEIEGRSARPFGPWVAVGLGFASICSASCRSRPGPATAQVSIAVPYELASLDPHVQNSVSHFAVLSHLYEGLVTMDADMRIRPALARSWESPDSRTWIFHIRPDVTFHGGRPLRAADVVYSLETLRAQVDREMGLYVLDVSSVERTDDLTVVIRTSRPAKLLLNKLSFVLVVPEGATPEALKTAADGTGPYRLVEWRGDRIRLRRNERYWGDRPALGDVEVALGRSPERALGGLRAGEHQLAHCGSLALEGSVPSSRFEVVGQEGIYVKYLGYDVAREVTPFCSVRPNPFRDARVRRAIRLAMDRKRLVARIPGRAVPAMQLVPRPIFGFAPDIAEPPHDPAEARRLLEAAGLGGGFDVVLHVRGAFADAASFVQEQLAEVGLRVRVEALSDIALHERMGGGGSTFWLSRWGCQTGDASDAFENLLHSPDPGRGLGLYNWGGFADPEVDRAIEDLAAVEDGAERAAALHRLMARLADDPIVLPLYVDQDAYVVSRSLTWRPRADGLIRAAEIGLRR